jgi:purine-binding chemotaxis protein CheW
MTASVRRVQPADTARRECLLFRIGAELFAIDLAAVDEAIELPEVHGFPEMPGALLGVFALREHMLPVYSPAECLEVALTTDAGVVLVMRDADGRRVGLAVDDIEDVIVLDSTMVRRSPVPDATDTLLLGVARHGTEPVALVDAASLVAACTAISPAVSP